MTQHAGKWPVQQLFGVPINAISMKQSMAAVQQSVRLRQPLQIGVVNAAKVLRMRSDALLSQDVLSSDMILADGMSIVWAGRLLRRPLPERVTGIDLMMNMLATGNGLRWRIYFLGATDETLARTKTRLAAEYPNLQIAGMRNGYFSADEEAAIAAEISAARPDVLLIAMTSPKKERFLARWSGELNVPVCHGVGGSFDVFAGQVRRAPQAWQQAGLEWLYRLAQEPRRLWRRYLVTNTQFCLLVARELVSSFRTRPGNATNLQ